MRTLLIIGLLFPGSFTYGVFAQQTQVETAFKELPNFHQVNAKLYRGAQPKEGGFKRLAVMGMKTIVSLRASDELARAEEVEVHAAGLRYFNVPLKRRGRPTDQQVDQILAIINASENQPVFVHCQHGMDRTGLIIACYRIAHDGWTSKRAKDEANSFGMQLHFWEWDMKEYIDEFYLRNRSLPRQI